MDLKQVHKFIVRPTLDSLGLGGLAAERLILGTALTESGLVYISQVPSGIAKGICQMEKATHDDIWENYLKYNHNLSNKVTNFMLRGLDIPNFEQLQGNLYYAVAMCRIHYLRAPEKIPDAEDFEGMAKYWKKYYNTILGAGRTEDFKTKATQIKGLV
jgi:hypothetical protein